MTQMLADVLKDHLTELAKEGELSTDTAVVETYISNALNAGAIAYAISEAMKAITLTIDLEPEIIILTEF